MEKTMDTASAATPRTRLLFTLLLLLLTGLLLLAGCTDTQASQTDTEEDFVIPPPSAGTRIEPPREVADFTLTSHEQEQVSLSDFRGKPVMLYFGYTFCPDICPTTLAEFVQVKRKLGEQADDVAFIFVSVDGERDTPERIATYLSAFDEDFIGMTGDEQQIRKIGVDYGLFFEKSQVEGTSADYLIDHTAASFLIDQQGRLHTVYAYGMPPDIISEDILMLLEEGEA
jgi:protein SCO1/2